MNEAISFRAAFWFWLKLGFISFGGPAGQISIMHAELVERRRWISERRFMHALNYCMLLPGPEAQQLATYMGWLMHKTWGGIVAGALFVLPSLFILIALSWLYIGFNVPFPLIVLVAACAGFLGGRLLPEKFRAGGGHHGADKSYGPALIDDDTPMPPHARFNWPQLARVVAVTVVFWCVPMLALWLLLGWDATYTQMAWFFTKAALLTFGGAYAVLPYVYQGAVTHYGWLTPVQMIDGLAPALWPGLSCS